MRATAGSARCRRTSPRIFAAAALERGLVAVEVASLDRRDVLFRYNADRLVMPASNMKIPTLAAAAERLGWDYTFHTTLAATGPVVEGTLLGDLVVRGNGDPSLNARQVSPIPVLDGWADLLAAHGIRRIAGRLVGDDNAFDERELRPGLVVGRPAGRLLGADRRAAGL